VTDNRERTMRCAMCGRQKSFDGFPVATIFAECWECVWKCHCRVSHKPKRKWHARWPFFRDPIDEPENANRVETEDRAAENRSGWYCTGTSGCPCPGLHGSA